MELIYIYITLEAPEAQRIVFEKDPCKGFITCLLGLSLVDLDFLALHSLNGTYQKNP